LEGAANVIAVPPTNGISDKAFFTLFFLFSARWISQRKGRSGYVGYIFGIVLDKTFPDVKIGTPLKHT